MPSVFLVSDPHFGHHGVCKFLREDGTKLRPWDDAEKMTWDMVDKWNQTVRLKDKVYCLGDMVINRKWLYVLGYLNGDKVLLRGNHDIFKLNEYTPYFRDIRAYHIMDKFILSHIPVHPSQLSRWKGNIHGHLHANHLDDKRYLNVCVENTEYKPVLFEQVRKQFEDRLSQ